MTTVAELNARLEQVARGGSPSEIIGIQADLISALQAELAALRAGTGAPSQRPAGGCTELSDAWCPVHGDCACDRAEGLDDRACPLHAVDSTHAETAETEVEDHTSRKWSAAPPSTTQA